MPTRILAALILHCALATAAFADKFQDDLNVLSKGLPHDAGEIVTRIAQCNHWSSGEAHDPARAKEIEGAIRKYGCNTIDRDEARLRKRYAGNSAVLKALDRAQSL